jgi:UTP--glucose-1-phosphate uridylyltransferase
MIEIYQQYQCSVVAIQEVAPEETNKYGIVAGELVDGRDDLCRVTTMVEKPEPHEAPSNLSIIGRYLLTADIFDILRETKPGKAGEIQLTDALLQQAKQGKVLAYKFKGKRFDCGSVDGFVEATNHFYESMKETK